MRMGMRMMVVEVMLMDEDNAGRMEGGKRPADDLVIRQPVTGSVLAAYWQLHSLQLAHGGLGSFTLRYQKTC